MIDVEVPLKEYFVRVYAIRFQPYNKPFVKLEKYNSSNLNEDQYYLLDDELHDWCISQNISYSLKKTNIWFIEFNNATDAMLFKLTWV